MTRFADQFHTRDQVDRLFVLGVPPSNSQHRTIVLKGKGHARQVDASSWLHTHLVEGEPFAVCPQLGVLGCTADVLPSVAINGRLESNPIELPVTNENDVSSCRHYLVDLLHQLQKCDETISEEVI